MKSQKLLALGGLMAVLLCSSVGYVVGQQSASSRQFLSSYLGARNAGSGVDFDKLARVYLKAPNDSVVVHEIVASAQFGPLVSQGAKGGNNEGIIMLLSLQVAQNQKLIQQNKQILEALKKKQ